MNLIEASIDMTQHIAEENSQGEGIDSYWKSVLPEIEEIFANEMFLTQHRADINEPMKHKALQIAQKAPLRDVGSLDDAELVLYCWMYNTWWGISDDPAFQVFVDNDVRGFIHLPDRTYWVRPSGLLLPISEGIARQIHFSLIERYKQARFAEYCWDELMHSIQGSEVKQRMSILLTCSEEFPVEQNEAYQWLLEKIRHLVPDDGEDAMHDWLEKLSRLPLHIRTQKIGVTLTAIKQGAIDIRRKGGQYKPTSLEDKLVNAIPNESTKNSNEEMMTDEEFSQRLLASQKKIEEILSRESPKKRRLKIGKRRFKVLQMLIDAPTLTSTEIAKRLGESDQTIGRDRDVVKQSRSQISEILDL